MPGTEEPTSLERVQRESSLFLANHSATDLDNRQTSNVRLVPQSGVRRPCRTEPVDLYTQEVPASVPAPTNVEQ